MFRHALESLRLVADRFFDLFRDVPPLPPRLLLPGVVALCVWPLVQHFLGIESNGQAFVSAFLLALALRIGLRIEGFLRHLAARMTPGDVVIAAVITVLAPLALLAASDDPLLCQRMQSAWFLIFGATFLSDMLGGRSEMAARLWPQAAMAPYLAGMTRAMLLHCLTFFCLNEMMIRAMSPGGWLVWWAVLPAVTHLSICALLIAVTGRRD